ncbi:threonine synthase, partial [Mediterraneibacter sp. 210702-DFI.5.30]|nr:threonine synthase [Mediterraneibacter sp. 210702-DFI.5.30]
MNYRSTRGNVKDALKSSDAVVQGLAPDGGLYVPVDFPKPAYDLEKLIQLPYQKLAQTILQWFFN